MLNDINNWAFLSNLNISITTKLFIINLNYGLFKKYN